MSPEIKVQVNNHFDQILVNGEMCIMNGKSSQETRVLEEDFLRKTQEI